VLVFAVDEGILQRAGYQSPRPLDFFLRKLALQVGTYQMVDLILPEFEAWSRRSAPGGGLGADLAQGNLNPFRRRDEAPVAFWSGVLDAGPKARTVSWTPPDYFNGQVRIMAVAVNDAAAGHGQASAIVRAPVVLSPNLLTAAAPGDEFDVTIGVSNQIEGAPDNLGIDVTVSTSEHLAVVGEASQTLALGEGAEGRMTLRLRALEKLGPAEMTVTATAGDTQVSRRVSTSVRPATAYVATVDSGVGSGDPFNVPLSRTLRSEYADSQVAASASPLILADGLLAYLEAFPHQCAEQMTSRVFPQLGLLDHPGLGVREDEVRASFDTLIGRLRARQRPDGGFSFWPGGDTSPGFASVYILHFLADAELRGLPVPRAMRQAGMTYLREAAVRDVQTLAQARVRAYAIYVLTRHEVVTSGPATDLHEWLDQQHTDRWRQDVAGSFLAATYQLLKQDALAVPLIRAYAPGGGDEAYSDFDTRLSRDAQHLYLLARHFPEEAARLDEAQLTSLIEPVMAGRFNTLSSAYTILALGEFTRAAAGRGNLSPLSLTFKDSASSPAAFARSDVPHDVSAVAVSGATGAVYYAASQRGYDAVPPPDALADGLELTREYLTAQGRPVTSAQQGDELTVRLRVRALGAPRSNVAITDLLPGGFDVLTDSVSRRFGGWTADYTDVREDRVVIYGRVGTQVTELNYRVKVTSSGEFRAPSAFAASMYDRDVRARTAPGTFTVTRP
ncbi:MAG: alpha-2-macroglobulin family protein, partial [Pseudomonadota bacterium]